MAGGATVAGAASATGAAEETVRFARLHALKLAALLERHHDRLPPAALKNKLVRNFLDAMRPRFGDRLVARVQAFVQAVNRAKPSGAKGTYVKKISLSSTMGPGVSVDVASAVAGA